MSLKRKGESDGSFEKKQKPAEVAEYSYDGGSVQQQLEYMKQLSSGEADPTNPSSLPKNLANEPPSRVVHFRNVTQDISQGDIISLCSPFGYIENVLTIRTKNQCLLMFKNLKSAIDLSNYYITNYSQPTIRGRKMYVSFSRHQTITAENSRVSNILLVTFTCNPDPEEAGVPITTDVVYQIFSPYGNVLKSVIVKKQSLQALVQYETQADCSRAYDYLNEQKVYVGTEPIIEIKLLIQYSHLADLTIRYTGPTSSDYTSGTAGKTPLLQHPLLPPTPSQFGAGGAPVPGSPSATSGHVPPPHLTPSQTPQGAYLVPSQMAYVDPASPYGPPTYISPPPYGHAPPGYPAPQPYENPYGPTAPRPSHDSKREQGYPPHAPPPSPYTQAGSGGGRGVGVTSGSTYPPHQSYHQPPSSQQQQQALQQQALQQQQQLLTHPQAQYIYAPPGYPAPTQYVQYQY